MDARLYKAAIDGDVGMLQSILQHDPTALHRVQTTSMGETVLHIAALLDRSKFIHEILHRNPALAREVNHHGYSPLHLASDNGHVQVVEELLKVSNDLCLLKDNDGRMPIHIAAMRGKIDVLDKLVQADFEALEKITTRGETVLHMCVKGNQMEALKFLSNKSNYNDLVNMKDAKGNTILHIATGRKATEIVKFLLRSTQIEANAKNQRGETALDLLPDQSPMADIDARLKEIIIGAGGLSGREPSDRESHILGIPNGLQRRESWKEKQAKHRKWLNESHGTLMVVATLIATITFQAGVNPPGGYYLHNQDGNNDTQVYFYDYTDGKAVHSKSPLFVLFLVSDVIGLFSSLCVILLMMTALPLKKKILTRILVRVMFVAIIFTGLAFIILVGAIFAVSYMAAVTLSACLLLWIIIIVICISWQLLQIIFCCCPKFQRSVKWATLVFSTVVSLVILFYGRSVLIPGLAVNLE